MQTFQIYKNLARINALSAKKAEAVFLDCCGSPAWARRMAQARPFRLIDDLYETAERIWYSLSTADRLAAFAVNGNGTDKAVKTKAKALDDVKDLYQQKFGFIFVASAAGKTADEILAICRARLGNSVKTELHIATDEQRKIIETRLTRLLEK